MIPSNFLRGGVTIDVFDALKAMNVVTKNMLVDSGEFVDLGLPSGTLWAKCNLGASAPEQAGKYFMWGDVNGHTASEGYDFSWGDGWDSTNKRFDPNGNYGKTAAAEITTDIPADPKYDAARAAIGGSARIPTIGDYIELTLFCTCEWTTLNSVDGNRFTGPNGNSIFLPYAGVFDGTQLIDEDSIGKYWLSSLLNVRNGFHFYINEGGTEWENNDRYYGQSVRAVI